MATSPVASYRKMYERTNEQGWTYDLTEAVRLNQVYQAGTSAFLLPMYRYDFNFALLVKSGREQNMERIKVQTLIIL